MKIGEFARKYNVSIDTVRYYMELELIIPNKAGGQYSFGDECCRSIEEILWLKDADFSLSEIQKIFRLKRLTNLKDEEDKEYYKSLFKNKREGMVERKKEIDKIIKGLDEKIKELETKISLSSRIGIPLRSLHIFACPKCGGELLIGRASIENNMIFEGYFECSCGFSAEIKNGIIKIENDYKYEGRKYPEYEGHYIDKTSNEFVNLFYKSGQWITSKIDFEKLHNKVILEPGVGSGILLWSMYSFLPKDMLYICIDHAIDRLIDTKEKMESNGVRDNVIFICSDFLDIPVKNKSCDIVIDHYGTSNYNFLKQGFLVHKLQDKVKPGGKWIGGYFNFKPNAKSLRQYPKESWPYFYLENIVKSFEESKFRALDMKDIGYTEKGGINERFFLEGEKLYDFVFYGEKVE